MGVILDQFEIGPMQNFQYFIGCDETREVAVIDPSWDIPAILNRARQSEFTITKILLTHGHFDHCEGIADLAKKIQAPVLISEDEAPCYLPDCPDIERIKNGQKIQIGHIDVECINTPGHSPGCVCFRCQDILITGDTLFINGCGHCHLPGGDAHALYHSLYDVLIKLPDTTVIYPGHKYGPWTSSTLAKQKECNPYLQCKNEDEFVHQRLGY